jgi:hypothetical protein
MMQCPAGCRCTAVRPCATLFFEERFMGLAERRVAKEFRDQIFPQWKQKIDTAAGWSVPVEIDWDSLQSPNESQLYRDAWPQVYFEPLVDALKEITVDDLGREAVRDKLQTIMIRHSGNKGGSFSGGRLMIDFPPTTNIDYGKERQQGIQQALELGL